MIMFKWT